MQVSVLKLVSLTTTVVVQDDRLALVHIPLDVYSYFLQPILQLMFHEVPPIDNCQAAENADNDDDYGDDPLEDSPGNPQPAFLNLSITPVECSVMCPRYLADLYFAPLVEQFSKVSSSSRSRVSISHDDFIAMQVYGEGLDAGKRVLELTSPLAMAGM